MIEDISGDIRRGNNQKKYRPFFTKREPGIEVGEIQFSNSDSEIVFSFAENAVPPAEWRREMNNAGFRPTDDSNRQWTTTANYVNRVKTDRFISDHYSAELGQDAARM